MWDAQCPEGEVSEQSVSPPRAEAQCVGRGWAGAGLLSFPDEKDSDVAHQKCDGTYKLIGNQVLGLGS